LFSNSSTFLAHGTYQLRQTKILTFLPKKHFRDNFRCKTRCQCITF